MVIPLRWTPPTVRDRLRALRDGVAESATPDDDTPNPSLPCPTCGRVVAADRLTDLRSMPRAMRAELDLSATACCDACRERRFLTGRVSPAQWVTALGAPLELVQKLRSGGA